MGAATGTRFSPTGALLLAGFRGPEVEAAPLIEAVIANARTAGQGGVVQVSQWAAAVLYNGLGRYEAALAEAQRASEQASLVSMWALPELVEAANEYYRAARYLMNPQVRRRVTGFEAVHAYRTVVMPARMRSMPARNCSRSSCPASCAAA